MFSLYSTWFSRFEKGYYLLNNDEQLLHPSWMRRIILSHMCLETQINYIVIGFRDHLIQRLVHRIWTVTSARKSFYENNTFAAHHSCPDRCFASRSVGTSPTVVNPYFYLFEGFAEDEILSRYRGRRKRRARGMKLGLRFGMDKGRSFRYFPIIFKT